jgi:hypothetical protein
MSARFTRSNLPVGPFGAYRKRTVTRAKQMHEPFECITIDDNVASGKPGDYLCIDHEGYPYPCAESVFNATMEAVDGP